MSRKEELERKAEFLEHHWVLAQKELEQSQQLQQERKAEHDRMLTDERAKHAKELFETENRIAELKKAHASQCDDLCREVLKANLEADRLHGQLNDGTVRQTNFLSNSKKPARSFFTRAGPFLAFWLILVSLLLLRFGIRSFPNSQTGYFRVFDLQERLRCNQTSNLRMTTTT